jgi:hypothetical protein
MQLVLVVVREVGASKSKWCDQKVIGKIVESNPMLSAERLVLESRPLFMA